MTFPRVHHADYFSDSGPVDGTVLVNSHSDVIEALEPTTGTGAPSVAGTLFGQTYFDNDSSYHAYMWNGSAWQEFDAHDHTASSNISILQSTTATLVAVETVVGNTDPITFGVADPPAPTIWFDRSTTPYTQWVFDPAGPTWHDATPTFTPSLVGPRWFPGL